jgi:putative ABC transport system permease protein
MRSTESLRRSAGVVGLAVRRVVGRLRGPGSRSLVVTVAGVALAVALVTVVTAVSLGLASGSAVSGDDVDYWVVPEGGTVRTVAADAGGPSLGDTHRVAAGIASDDAVDYATPVLVRVVPVRTAGGTDGGTDADARSRGRDSGGGREYLVLLGVVPPADGAPRVGGLPTAPLSPGDPHYANGRYDGRWTGELVASEAAATVLNASTGSELVVRDAAGTTRGFRVTNVSAGGGGTGVGAAPVALVHLSELQAVAGATEGDTADQILVATDAPGVRDRIATLYPRTDVVTRAGFVAGDAGTDSLALAMALAALVVAVVVGTLFAATTMGLAVNADRANLAALAALGYSGRSRALLVGTEALVVALVGGAVGVALGVGGTLLVDALSVRLLGVGDVALLRPVVLAYGLGVAACIGLLSAPYPVWVTRRVAVTEALGR